MKPFVKWAGGKTQLLEDIRKVVPHEYRTYFEPFLGGGAVFLDIKPERAVVSDINPQLINAYVSIRDDVQGLMARIDDLDKDQRVTQESYYAARDKYNDYIRNDICSLDSAALMIWINHHCFNGLYRTNREGLFNTPWNRTESHRLSYERDNLLEIADYLRNNDITLLCEDYKKVLSRASEGDFAFLDPPYDPVGKYSDFKRYAKNQFYENDQRELSVCIKDAVDRGVKFCLTNSNTDLIHGLYDEYNFLVIQTHRNINSRGEDRFGEDAIITA